MEDLWGLGLRAFVLIAALSLDAWAASFAYGVGGIRIPPASLLVISGVCSALLGASMLAGELVSPLLPGKAAAALSFWILLLLGVTRLFDSSFKSWIRHRGCKTLRLRLPGARLILQIYADASLADRDLSRVLSPGEAASLALALSLDGLAAGVGAGMGNIPLIPAVLLSGAVHWAAVSAGFAAGRRCSRRTEKDLSWLGGAMLILLALLRS